LVSDTAPLLTRTTCARLDEHGSGRGCGSHHLLRPSAYQAQRVSRVLQVQALRGYSYQSSQRTLVQPAPPVIACLLTMMRRSPRQVDEVVSWIERGPDVAELDVCGAVAGVGQTSSSGTWATKLGDEVSGPGLRGSGRRLGTAWTSELTSIGASSTTLPSRWLTRWASGSSVQTCRSPAGSAPPAAPIGCPRGRSHRPA
jgi:hypothetical protein